MEPNPLAKFALMKKALVSPLKDIDRIYNIISSYLLESEDLSFDVLRHLAK